MIFTDTIRKIQVARDMVRAQKHVGTMVQIWYTHYNGQEHEIGELEEFKPYSCLMIKTADTNSEGERFFSSHSIPLLGGDFGLREMRTDIGGKIIYSNPAVSPVLAAVPADIWYSTTNARKKSYIAVPAYEGKIGLRQKISNSLITSMGKMLASVSRYSLNSA
jgi:hypothetical protein